MADGSLIFETKIDNTGFEQGMEALEKAGAEGSAAVEKAIAGGGLAKAVAALSDAAMAEARKKAGDYQSLGTLYVNAMKTGIAQSRDEAVAAVKELVAARIAAYKKETDAETAAQVSVLQQQAKRTGSYGKQLIQEQIASIKEETKASQTAYGNAAKTILAAFTASVKEGAKEAQDAVSESVLTLTRETQAAYEEILDKQSRMESKLAGYGDMFDVKDDGTALTHIEMSLRMLDRYEDVLERLQEQGAPPEFMEMFAGLDVDEGVSFGEELLGLGSVRFEKYMENWQTQQKRAKEIAEKFYGEELALLEEDFSAQLGEKLAAIPDQVEGVGISAMEGFILGLESKRQDALDTAGDIADAVKNRMAEAFEINSPSRWMKREIGENLALGLGEGFTETMPRVESDLVRSALDSLTGAAYALSSAGVSPAAEPYREAQTVKEYHNQTVVREKVVGVQFSGTGAEVARLLKPKLEKEDTRIGRRFTGTGGV